MQLGFLMDLIALQVEGINDKSRHVQKCDA